MGMFDEDERIYRKAARRRLAAVRRDAERGEDMLPDWEPRQAWQLACKARPTVHAAVLKYAAELGGAHLWLMTFAANLATIEVFAEHEEIKPACLVFSRNCLTRSPTMLDAARKWCGNVALRRVHAKVAVLIGETGTMTISGSANLSKNSGLERMDLSSHKAEADRWAEVIEATAAEVEGRKR